jgi:hypothetical protein
MSFWASPQEPAPKKRGLRRLRPAGSSLPVSRRPRRSRFGGPAFSRCDPSRARLPGSASPRGRAPTQQLGMAPRRPHKPRGSGSSPLAATNSRHAQGKRQVKTRPRLRAGDATGPRTDVLVGPPAEPDRGCTESAVVRDPYVRGGTGGRRPTGPLRNAAIHLSPAHRTPEPQRAALASLGR